MVRLILTNDNTILTKSLTSLTSAQNNHINIQIQTFMCMSQSQMDPRISGLLQSQVKFCSYIELTLF